MSEEIRLLGAFGVALFGAYALTPLAITVAERVGFHDTPFGYKAHRRPTPYLGGAAVVLAFGAGALLFAGAAGRWWPVLAAAAFLWAVGTLDDKLTSGPTPRILAEIAAASFLWQQNLGWAVFDSDLANLAFTNLWVIGLVNAFNLMDNMDGAAGTVAAASSFGIGMFALFKSDPVLAALAFAVSGACAGFLPYNLASPARIFLGDGGSMPIGFLVASAAIALPFGGGAGWGVLLTVMLVGLPLFDTALVIVSRRRRGVPLLQGGRDHTTHRIHVHLPSPRAVAATLGSVQAALCGVAVAMSQFGQEAMAAASATAFVLGIAAVWVLEMGPLALPREES